MVATASRSTTTSMRPPASGVRGQARSEQVRPADALRDQKFDARPNNADVRHYRCDMEFVVSSWRCRFVRVASLLALLLVGCRSTTPTPSSLRSDAPAPSVMDASAPAAADTSAPAVPAASAAAPAPPVAVVACGVSARETVLTTTKADEYGFVSLENARVAATPEATLVSWEERSNFDVGDSWREAHFAVKRGAGPWKKHRLTAMAYACATYGYIAPLQREAEVGSVTWGVANSWSLDVLPEAPAMDAVMDGVVPKKPLRSVDTKRAYVRSLVAAGDVAVTITGEDACPDCSCGAKGDGVRAFGIGATRFDTLIAKAASPDAVAVASSKDAIAVSYRSKGRLYLAWLGPNGASLGPPAAFSVGEPGAAALGLVGDRLVIVWAERSDKTAPYVLQLATAAAGSAPSTPRALTTQGSAFAPALLLREGRALHEDELLLAWMEGDGKSGKVLAARTTLARPDLASVVTVSEPDESNARDPELGGTVDAPTLVYGSFSNALPGGKLRLARISCASR
jgi:hypothetical protein